MITQGADNPTRIAIAPMSAPGMQLTEDISQIVSNDLEFTGQFAAIPRRDMLSFPRSEAEVHYRDWTVLKAEYLVAGSVELRGGRRSEEHTSELQSRENLVCRRLLEKKIGYKSSGLPSLY